MLARLDGVRLDAAEREQRAHRGVDLLAHRLRVGGRSVGGLRRVERAHHRERSPCAAARRVDREVDRLAQLRDARAVLAPRGEPFAPLRRHLRRALGHRASTPRRVARIDPRLEIPRRERRKREEQVSDVTFGIDADRGHSVDRGLFEERDAEARLAAARHADADRVGRQITRVVEQRRSIRRARRVEGATEVEGTELLELRGAGRRVRHRARR